MLPRPAGRAHGSSGHARSRGAHARHPGRRHDEKPAASETETTSVEEPGDQSLPGGGHADPAGQNVDHQFDGVE